MKVKKAIIPAAGLGTRVLPASKAVPKEMLNIVDKPAIQYLVEEAVAAGIEDILIITNRGKGVIEDHFDHSFELEANLAGKKNKEKIYEEIKAVANLANIYFIRQKETKGLGHAILCGKSFVGDEPFAVLFGDDVMYNETRPVIGQLIDVYEKYGKTVLGCKRVSMDVISKYASVEYDKILENDVYNMTKLTEKPKKEEAKSDLAPLGRYVCSPGIFRIIDNLKPGANNEYQFTDALDLIARSEGALAYVFDGTRYDMGDRFGYLKANIEYGLRDAELKDKLKEYLKELIAE